jgi:hypothetical protein
MTIIKKKKEANGIMVYTVKKDLTDEQTEKMNGKFCTDRSFKDLIDHDADVYTEEGDLLLKFRKNVLPQHNVNQAYDNLIEFANNVTAARGAASGSKIKDIRVNKKIKSNIYGYFDKWTIFQKHMFKTLNIKPPSGVRVTRFTKDYPDKWEKIIPLIQNIDQQYKKLAPVQHKFQKKHANETAFRIADTAFTTITTNVNTQTACHTDSGNLNDSFGNLIVLEKGKYEGAILCYPQYKVGVNVRSGDFLAMCIHKVHGNTPIKLKSPDTVRMSIVSYLRQGVWEKSKGSKPEDVKKNMDTMTKIVARFNKKKAQNKKDDQT